MPAATAQQREDRTLDRAQRIIESRWQKRLGPFLPKMATLHFFLRMRGLEREVFDVVFLDARLNLIATERLFTGTVDGAEVHAREIAKAALLHNASAVIISHNHPSGDPTPSVADRRVTYRVRDALALLDVRLVDHIVIGGTEAYSFAAEGWK